MSLPLNCSLPLSSPETYPDHETNNRLAIFDGSRRFLFISGNTSKTSIWMAIFTARRAGSGNATKQA